MKDSLINIQIKRCKVFFLSIKDVSLKFIKLETNAAANVTMLFNHQLLL